jgi:hypothetical protein
MLGRLLAERQKQLQRSGGVDAFVVDEICDHYETALSLLQDVSAPQRFLLGGVNVIYLNRLSLLQSNMSKS